MVLESSCNMPLKVIRDSIYKVDAECRVHPTYQSYFDYSEHYFINRHIKNIYYEIDIHRPKVYLTEAVLTFEEDTLYTMHVVGPRFIESNIPLSIELLEASYINCFELALKEDINSIAFPLISAGGKGFPKTLAFDTAKQTLETCLLNHPDLNVSLVVYEDEMYEVAKSYIESAQAYVKKNFKPEVLYNFMQSERTPFRLKRINASYSKEMIIEDKIFDVEDLEVSESFSRTLHLWLEKKGMKDSELYKKIYMSKQTFNKIINGKTEKPNQKTILLLAFGLKLNLDETLDFMEVVGYTFSKSSQFDLIVKYFIQDKNFDLHALETTLFELTGQTLVNYNS
jgi:O-acetyl-ADP-ribose deacetylase (regulator of RNase III)/transcriptional regulator with XRE-family HTH domain